MKWCTTHLKIKSEVNATRPELYSFLSTCFSRRYLSYSRTSSPNSAIPPRKEDFIAASTIRQSFPIYFSCAFSASCFRAQLSYFEHGNLLVLLRPTKAPLFENQLLNLLVGFGLLNFHILPLRCWDPGCCDEHLFMCDGRAVDFRFDIYIGS